MEKHNIFEGLTKGIIGYDSCINTPYGQKRLVYADWIASRMLYQPIEDIMTQKIGPMVANTHSET